MKLHVMLFALWQDYFQVAKLLTVSMANRKKFTSSSLTDPAVVIELIYY